MPALFFLLVLTLSGSAKSEERHRLLNLRGDWKFELGDNARWADPKFDDRKWSEVYVPSSWEDEGYPDYDGYAWYRVHLTGSDNWQSKDLVLDLGTIDDVDETFINGEMVGSTGSFPPDYATAYNVERVYSIPPGVLKPGEDNVIAVRVYDDQLSGGIIDGRVGIYERRYDTNPDLRLPAVWKFKTGDDMDWKEVNFDDKNWKSINVPAYWENQGFKNYDGYAWYRTKFNVPSDYQDRNLIFLVGKIDDFDEVYLNGQRIGRTGPMPKYDMHRPDSDEYLRTRAYTIPSGLLRPGAENVLAVRVYDCWQGGGIYEGPIGIVTKQHYVKYHRTARAVEGWFENLFDDIFGWRY